MKKYFYLSVILLAYSQFGFAQNLTQTRTATYLNNLGNFRQAYGVQNYKGARAQDVASDNNKYACTGRLLAVSDSTSPVSSRSVSSLSLQGFGFNIPVNATIQNITIRLRRFKKGSPSIGDFSLSLMKRYGCNPDDPCMNGVTWTFEDDEDDAYPGRVYPATETEYLFSQSGSGNDGGFGHNEIYQWTPAIVNHEYFGVRIENYPPIGEGYVQVCYDLVEVTIDYSVPEAQSKTFVVPELLLIKEVKVYPNPFTTKSTLQFTAAENGTIVVELYNSIGSKVRTLFTGKVEKGRTYNVAAGDSRLPKGVYVYKVSNGKQLQTGRMIKNE